MLKSYTADGTAYPSIRYTFEPMLRSINMIADVEFADGIKFLFWNDVRDRYRYGLVNVAAFLANAMVEGIYDDSCDELNWQQVAGNE